MGRSEGMVIGYPSLLFIVPTKRGKVEEPSDFILLPIKITKCCLGSDVGSQMAQRLANNLRLVGDEYQQIAGRGAQSLAQALLHRCRQEFGIGSRETVGFDFHPKESLSSE